MRIAFTTSGTYMDQEYYAARILLASESQIFALSKVLAAKGHEISILRRWRSRETERIDGVNILSVTALLGYLDSLGRVLSKALPSFCVRTYIVVRKPEGRK